MKSNNCFQLKIYYYHGHVYYFETPQTLSQLELQPVRNSQKKCAIHNDQRLFVLQTVALRLVWVMSEVGNFGCWLLTDLLFICGIMLKRQNQTEGQRLSPASNQSSFVFLIVCFSAAIASLLCNAIFLSGMQAQGPKPLYKM